MYTYLWCFFIFGFFGWCGEVVYAAFIERRFVNRGFLNGPICPIYGFGVVLIDLCLRPLGRGLPVLLIGSMVVGSALEWAAGFLLERVFHQKWWDYSDEPHNLNGYICLKFSLLWALAGTGVELAVIPASRTVVALIPRNLGWAVLGVLLALTLVDFFLTAMTIIGMNRKLKTLESLSGAIRSGTDRLGEGLYAGTVAVEDKAEELGAIAAAQRVGERAAQLGTAAQEKAQEVGAKAAQLGSLAQEKAHEMGDEWQRRAARLREKYAEGLQVNPMAKRLLKAFPDLLRAVRSGEQLEILRHNVQLETLHENVNALRQRSLQALERRNEQAREVYELRVEDRALRPFAYRIVGYEMLFWVFLSGSVIGFVCETLYALAVPPHVFELRVSLLVGPFILIYGFGGIAFTVVLRRLYNQSDLLIFFTTMVIGAFVEYVCSFVQQAWFGTVSWEYSGSTLNLGGRTNLMYSVFWGILGVLWVKDLFPPLARFLRSLPRRGARLATVIVSILLAVDVLLSAGAVARWAQRSQGIPPENAVDQAYDRLLPDQVMRVIYPHMEFVGKPAIVENEPPLPPNQD